MGEKSGTNRYKLDTDPPLTYPHTEILMDCLDIVTCCDPLEVVINTNAQFDNLWYERFQKSLDQWRMENYPDVLESVKRDYPGLTDSQYARLAEDRLFENSIFEEARYCSKPTIDLTKNTLLGMHVYGTGCRQPDFLIEVHKNYRKKQIIFTVTITTYGGCEPLPSYNKWIIIPKISDSYEVIFRKKHIEKP